VLHSKDTFWFIDILTLSILTVLRSSCYFFSGSFRAVKLEEKVGLFSSLDLAERNLNVRYTLVCPSDTDIVHRGSHLIITIA